MFIRLAVILTLLASTIPASAKSMMMKPAEYQAFVKTLENYIPMWQQQVEQTDLSAGTAESREEVRKSEMTAIAFLRQVADKLRYEEEHPSLSRQIYITRDLSVVASALGGVVAAIPGQAAKTKLETALQTLAQMNDRLFVHVVAKADDYEFRLDDCGTQSKPK